MKTFTAALVRRLNAACARLRPTCAHDCLDIGWCDACWKEAL